MAEPIKLKLKMSDLAGWKPYDGVGAGDLFTHDGTFSFSVEKIIQTLSKEDKKPMLLVSLICQDEDNKGRKTLSNVHVGGVDSKGNPMIRQLGDFLQSAGYTAEQITTELAAAGDDLDGDDLVAMLTNPEAPITIYAECNAEEYNSNCSTKPKNWTTKEVFETRKAAGSWRKPIALQQGFSGNVKTAAGVPSGAAAGGSGAVALGGKKPAAEKEATNGATGGNALGKIAAKGKLGLGLRPQA